LGEATLERGHEALRRVLRCREHLDDADGASLGIDQRGVGEGAADVDADSQRGHRERRARSALVEAASSACVAGSPTMPYTARGRPADILPSATSAATASAGRSSAD